MAAQSTDFLKNSLLVRRRKMSKKVIDIRPHHGMCLAYYQGKGYSEGFTGHMYEMKAQYEKNAKVRLTVSTDEICAACPNNGEGICKSAEKVASYDRAVLECCGLQEGQELPYKTFADRVQKAILRSGRRPKICGGCQWDALCHEEPAQQFGRNIKAVIFDLDGTLIDTEKYYRVCWPKALAHFGYEMTDEQALSLRSLGQPFAPAYLKEMFRNPKLDYPAIRAYRKQLMEEALEQNGIEIKPGAVELLTYLRKKGIITAIATATDMERATRYLKKIGLYDYFDRVISATMVEKGKPSPDIYQYACRQLGLAPEECMAVEDSPNGIMSAHLANCIVVMVPDQTEPDEHVWDMLDVRVDTLSDIIGFF
jgi:DNA helicase-2/ATP-dependent DNA helicase PcrA